MSGLTAAALTTAHIDLGALQHNIGVLRERAAPADFMIVLKADAYGHGAVPVAQAAAACGVRNFGALDIPNALTVLAAGLPSDSAVLAWLHMPSQDFTEAVDAGIELTASTVAELDRIAGSRSSRVPVVQFKIDTGLNRNGATAETWPALMSRAAVLEAAGRIRVKGVWTHIAEASEDEDTLAMRRFDDAIAVAATHGVHFSVRHLAASSAAFRRADVRYDMVRIGGHCWGIPSFDGVTPADMGLIPVMTLVSRVTAVAERASGVRLAEIAAGFLDGIPRESRGRVSVAIRGRRVGLDREIGHSSTLVEVTGSDIAVGDEVYLFGTGEHSEQTVREWGDRTGTLGDEIVSRVGARVPRIYSGTN
ncbi:alanine racemase [Microbacterium sp. STN6]|uniref:alanine racemase n=1 Tax=Microbacterium sp. STN6 TaxID=2995588 RepID=UPI002260C04C|nr:alanine racemase [Microbacterium sp. STN6]MCX7522434.1 alanine racemase [Microbacterium sp. STN6]